MVKDTSIDFHTQFGTIPADQFEKEQAKSSKGDLFLVLDPYFKDLDLKRGPQIVQTKDVGYILAWSGCNKKFKVVDAGGGSGSMCLALANVCDEITTYEINAEHFDVVQRNIKLSGMTNIHARHASIYNGIKEDELDLITLDLPEPWRVIEHAKTALKPGGFLVVYLPNLTQVTQFIESTRKTPIYVDRTLELLERTWKIHDKILRPEFQMLGHTGFLILCRRF